jgi:Lrp/AsnC family leucine-responsive transcriptional regulator
MPVERDATDLRLLRALQDDARLTSTELASLAHLSQSPCWRRVRRLESVGLIRGYRAQIDRQLLGYGVMAFVMVTIDHQNEASSLEFERAVLAIPEVVLCHGISGPHDFILAVVAADLQAYSALLQGKLHRLPHVQHMQTYFSLQEFKGSVGPLPIPAA